MSAASLPAVSGPIHVYTSEELMPVDPDSVRMAAEEIAQQIGLWTVLDCFEYHRRRSHPSDSRLLDVVMGRIYLTPEKFGDSSVLSFDKIQGGCADTARAAMAALGHGGRWQIAHFGDLEIHNPIPAEEAGMETELLFSVALKEWQGNFLHINATGMLQPDPRFPFHLSGMILAPRLD